MTIISRIDHTHRSALDLTEREYCIADAIEQLSQNTGYSSAGLTALSNALGVHYDNYRKLEKGLIQRGIIEQGDRKRQLKPSEMWYESRAFSDKSTENGSAISGKSTEFSDKSTYFSGKSTENDTAFSDKSTENFGQIDRKRNAVSGKSTENKNEFRTNRPKISGKSTYFSGKSTENNPDFGQIDLHKYSLFRENSISKESTKSTVRDLRDRLSPKTFQMLAGVKNEIEIQIGKPKYDLLVEWLEHCHEIGKAVRTTHVLHGIVQNFGQHTEAQIKRVTGYSRDRQYPTLYWADQAEPKKEKNYANTTTIRRKGSNYAAARSRTNLDKYDEKYEQEVKAARAAE